MAAAPVVAIISQGNLRPYVADLLIQQEDAAVVTDAQMCHGHAHITDYSFGQVSLEELLNTFPAVVHSVLLVEVVLASIAWYLQFRSDLEGKCFVNWPGPRLGTATDKHTRCLQLTRYVAPFSLASAIEVWIRSRLP